MSDLSNLVKSLESVPGGQKVVESCLAMANFSQELVRQESNKISQNIARVENQIAGLNQSLTAKYDVELKNAMTTIADVKSRQERLEKQIADIFQKLDLFGALWSGLKEAVTKKV